MKNILSDLGCGHHLSREMQLRRMQQVIRHELTELQRDTLMAYYFDGKKLKQIAEERGVRITTVWRTLKRAEDKLRRFMKY